MKTTTCGLIRASTIAIALLGSTAIVATVATPDFAYAKEGKGNGGGNGNGGGKGGGNGGGKGGGNGGGNGNGAKGDSGDSSSAGNSSRGKGADKNRSGSKAGKSGHGTSKSQSAQSGQRKGGGFSLKGLFSGKGNARKSTSTSNETTTTRTQNSKTAHRSKTVEESIRPVTRPRGNRIAEELEAHPSELGALNAANASPTALANASPNSRVGKIAAYRDTVLAGEPLREDLAEALEELEGLEPPERTLTEIENDLEGALRDVQDNRDKVEELEQALEDAGGMDPDIEAELEEAKADLDSSIDAAEELNDEKQAAIDYNDAVEDVEDLTERVEEQNLAEREALEAAANKPVTDTVEEKVKSLLDL
ncbi:hypothetical protein [Ruegeria sp. HKCCC2117]|uniref:hypothetical protein n=1 Tax=Ruegeria sp. HKCCC2117 TaxID=2682992 RepID=UPI00148785DC|nr:hypothetical protein [Ruegeria sp. HKCCC2117]